MASTRSKASASIASMTAVAESPEESAIVIRLRPESCPRFGFRRGLAAAFACVALARAAGAQPPTTPPTLPERPPLGATFTVDAFSDLPASATIFSLLDTAVPDVIADRIDTGGLNAGQPARTGAHGSTWTQTLYRIGDVNITNPAGAGTPLLLPGVEEWERTEVVTGLMPMDVDAPGMAVTLRPRRPFTRWMRSLDLIAAPAGLIAGSASSNPPAIERLNNWAHANLVLGGPIASDRLGLFMADTWTRSSQFERGGTGTFDASLTSAFVHVVGTPSPSNEISVVGWGQRGRAPVSQHAVFADPNTGAYNTGLHTQASWEHRMPGADGSVRAFGAFTQAHRTSDVIPQAFTYLERLRDGPVTALIDPGVGTDRVWTVGARARRSVAARGRHDLVAGLDLTGRMTLTQSTFTGRVGELLNGAPARIWDFTDPTAASDWRDRTIAAFVGDTFAVLPRLTLNGGLRFDAVAASAGTAAPAISWRNWLPRVGLHASILDDWNLGTFAQFERYAHRLPLSDLAYGDPAAPTASVYRWNASTPSIPGPDAIGPLVQRIGPGTGGDPRFSAIDPALRRPYMDELVFGLDAHPRPSTFLRMAAITRREQPLIGVVNVGVPKSSYAIIGVPDAGIDLIGTEDDQLLLFYNRSPATFGADRYLLTNPVDDVATFVGVDMIGEVHGERFFFIAGATAGRSEGLSASRGFGPLENDAAVLGEVYTNPNAAAYAQGRLFTERGYTIKTAMSYHFDRDLTLGTVARYQDGQHFARLVIQDLNQGPEAVRAFRNGRTRFTFSMTIDVRMQKGFTVNGHRMSAIVDGYNVFNQALEIEEFSVTGATSRVTAAVQPRRVFHIGVRIPF